MRQRLSSGATVLRTIARNARSEQITFLAAGVAYYAFVSLIPLSLLGLVITSVMGGAVFEDQLLETANDFLTPDAQELVVESLAGESGRGGATVVGMAVLLWSGLRLFRGLDKAFSQVYGTIQTKSIVSEMVNGMTVLGAIIVGVAAVTIVGTAIRRISTGIFVPGLGHLLMFAMLVVAFYPMYYVLPDTDVGGREAVPGTIVAAVGWVLLGVGFQVYTAVAADFAAYGVIGAVLVLVTWLYFGALIVMVGAVVNAVLADRMAELERTAQQLVPTPADDRDRGPERAETTGRNQQELRVRGLETTTAELMTGEDSRDRSEEDVAETDAQGPDTETTVDAEAGTGAGMAGPRPDDRGPDSRPGDREPDARPDEREAETREGAGAPAEPDVTDAGGERRDRTGTAPASEVARLNRELAELRSELADFEDRVEDRTVDRDAFESELKRYVRKRSRRGKARGWGPYLVLLYGTAMTIGAFYFLDGGWAILAMLVIWLSTLGLYVLMVLVGAGLQLLGLPGRIRDAVGSFRS